MKAFDFLEVWQKSLGVDGLLLLLAAAARRSIVARCPLLAITARQPSLLAACDHPLGGRCPLLAYCSPLAARCHRLLVASCSPHSCSPPPPAAAAVVACKPEPVLLCCRCC